MENFGAVILAAGKGTRMQTEVHKQFLLYKGKPLFLYSVEKFLLYCRQVLVVTGEEDIPACRAYLDSFGLADRVQVTEGGKERFDSSYLGLLFMKNLKDVDYVLIHDAARPFVDDQTIRRVMQSARESGTGIAAVPSKDTIRIADQNGYVKETPDRRFVWNIQTPQGFRLDLILDAYGRMRESDLTDVHITDDAMVIEQFTDHPVRLVTGSYDNLKITTPDDLRMLEK